MICTVNKKTVANTSIVFLYGLKNGLIKHETLFVKTMEELI
jgi:hypothetical protein